MFGHCVGIFIFITETKKRGLQGKKGISIAFITPSEERRINEIEKRIIKGEDIFGRDDSFNKIPLDSLFPSYLIENKDKYKDWIDE